MRKLLIFLTSIFLVSLIAVAEEEKKETEAKEVKTYTQEEFDKALKEALFKELKRFNQENIVDITKELLQKEEKIKESEYRLKKEKEAFVNNQGTFNDRVKAFEERQKKFIGCLDKQDTDKEKRVGHMVDVISGMKPNLAADILSVQESEISISILGRLDAVKVSKIFNSMDKEISARLQKQYMYMKK